MKKESVYLQKVFKN